jgi:hypothetical protein
MPLDFLFGYRPHHAVDEFSFSEKKQRRGASDSILRRAAGIEVDVDLRYFDASGIFRGKLVNDGSEPLTVPAVGGVKLHQNRPREVQYFVPKIPVKYFYRPLRESRGRRKRGPASSAQRLFSQAFPGNSILGPAIRADDDPISHSTSPQSSFHSKEIQFRLARSANSKGTSRQRIDSVHRRQATAASTSC